MSKLPHSRCNTITKCGNVLVGADPLDENVLSKIFEYGVGIIVNLYEEVAWYEDILPDDVKYIHFPIGNGRVPGSKKSKELVTEIISEYKLGKKIYIHCRGGHGRAGTIGALFLGKLENLDVAEAVERISTCRDTREDKSRNFVPTPETTAQVLFLEKELGLKSGNILPDRSDKSWLKRVKADRKAKSDS